jgi:hypothetical protein
MDQVAIVRMVCGVIAVVLLFALVQRRRSRVR